MLSWNFFFSHTRSSFKFPLRIVNFDIIPVFEFSIVFIFPSQFIPCSLLRRKVRIENPLFSLLDRMESIMYQKETYIISVYIFAFQREMLLCSLLQTVANRMLLWSTFHFIQNDQDTILTLYDKHIKNRFILCTKVLWLTLHLSANSR